MEKGRTLGVYEVVGRLGAGGMGQVFRARDTRLGRDVAIKLLLDEMTADRDRLARLEREARLMASVNHPNVASIHSLEEIDGVRFLVLELVDGRTLDQELGHGSVPMRLALEVCLQIAAGLEAAHEKGVVHRDLKPANVMIGESDRVKVLDFGVATLRAPVDVSSLTAQGASTDATIPGLLIGTLSYMSPEQVSGGRIDKRTDIWSFGCILFELLSGRRPFDRRTAAGTAAAILTSDPDWSWLPAETPVTVQSLIRRCLQKDVQYRWRDIGDASLELRDALADLQHLPIRAPAAPPVSPAPVAGGTRRRLGWYAPWLLVAGLSGVILWQEWRSSGGSPEPERRVVSVVPPAHTALQSAVVSPDGQRLVLVAADLDGPTNLWVRPLDVAEPQKLEGTVGATYPFWSPDSRSIAFFADGKLKRIDIGGGPAVDVSIASNPRGGTWNENGTIVFASSARGLMRVSAHGGEPIPLTELDEHRGENSHRFPSFLPDGKQVLYFSRNPVSPNLNGVYVVSLETGRTKQLLTVNSLAVYAPPGYLLYRRGEVLLAHAFDDRTLELSGDPVPVADNVWYDPSFTALANFGVTSSGLLVYRAGGIDKTSLLWLTRNGSVVREIAPPANYLNLYLSPDDRQVAVSRTDERTEARNLWVHDLGSGTARQLSFSKASDFSPIWSPDGRSIAFTSDRSGSFDLYRADAGGGSAIIPLLRSSVTKLVRDWSPDGQLLVYDVVGSRDVDIWTVRIDGSDAEPFHDSPADSWFGRLSPDGEWIAYSSNELGQYEAFVQRFPRRGGYWRISNGGGFQPIWHPSGTEVFYLAPDGKLMSVPLEVTESTFTAGPARALFQTRVNVATVNPPESVNHYDVSADGNHFLISSRLEADAVPIVLLFGWRASR